ncbi:MAG: oligosaccharide flippase family protein [Clostridia bacterium]|nr:oligosaccharide flippase family protein [Clostridia bacterium]
MIKIKHKKELRLPARASLFYLLASGGAKCAGLLFTPVFTRIMPAEEYGYYTLYISILALSSVITTAAATGGVMYKGYSSFKDEKSSFTSAAIGLSIILIPPVMIALLIFKDRLGIGAGLIPLIALQLLCDGAIAAKSSEKRYSYKYFYVVVFTLASSVLSPLVALVLIKFLRGSTARILGLLAVSIMLALPILTECVRVGFFKKEVWRFALRYSLPQLPNAIGVAVIAQADKLIISGYMGEGALASYSVAHSIGIGLTFITSSLGSALHPWIIRKLEGDRWDIVEDMLTKLFIALSSLAVIVVALSPEALGILTPKSYSVALPAILPITLSTLPTFLLSALAIISLHEGKSYYPSIASVVGAAVNVASNVWLVPRMSYLGAGLSLFISYTIATLLCYAFNKIHRTRLFSLSKFSLIFAMAALFSTAAKGLYDSLILRLLLIIAPIVMLGRTLWKMKDSITEKAET